MFFQGLKNIPDKFTDETLKCVQRRLWILLSHDEKIMTGSIKGSDEIRRAAHCDKLHSFYLLINFDMFCPWHKKKTEKSHDVVSYLRLFVENHEAQQVSKV